MNMNMNISKWLAESKEALAEKMQVSLVGEIAKSKKRFKNALITCLTGVLGLVAAMWVGIPLVKNSEELLFLFITMAPCLVLMLMGSIGIDNNEVNVWERSAQLMDDADWADFMKEEDKFGILSKLVEHVRDNGELTKFMWEDIKKEQRKVLALMGKEKVLIHKESVGIVREKDPNLLLLK